MAVSCLWVGLMLLVASAAISSAAPVASQDRKALLDLKKTVSYDPGLFDTWVPSSDCKKWYGVTCNSQGRVTALSIFQTYAIAQLPSSLGALSQLGALIIARNGFTGKIPASIANLTNLQYLDLSYNDFEGPLPASLGKLTKLTSLNLESNRFSGVIPTTLGGLTKLEYLDLNTNMLTGTIPTSLSSLTRLLVLALGENLLTGGIPPSLYKLKKLTSLILNFNGLTGTIPASLGDMVAIGNLQLDHNKLVGHIPSTFKKLNNTITLQLSSNALTGPVVVPDSSILSTFEVANTFVSGPLTLSAKTKSSCQAEYPLYFDVTKTCLRLTRSALGPCCPNCAFKSDAECKAFCNALQPGGACGGHGVCVAKSSGRSCVCDKGYKPAGSSNCVKSK